MFERFTDQSRRAVVLAQEEARRLGHNFIGTEHLLAGLRLEERGAAARALKSAGVSRDAILREIETIAGQSPEPGAGPGPGSGPGQGHPSGHIPFTPQAKKCLEFGLREATHLEHYFIGTGHLLLGLISQDDSAAVQVLGGLGTDLSQLRARALTEIEAKQEDRVRSAPPGWRLTGLPEAALALLDTIDERLSAIEQRLGVVPPGPGETGEAGQPQASQTSEASEASEALGASQAEVARLRALLREHGIDPGEAGDPPAVAG